MFVVGEDEDEDFVNQPAFIVIIVLGVVGVIVAVAIAVIIITVVSRHHINKRKEQHTGIIDYVCTYVSICTM